MRSLLRLALVGMVLSTASAVAADTKAPTPRQTLDDDLAGARVEWVARILQAYPATDDETCLLLQRTRSGGACIVPPGPTVLACAVGPFDGAAFATGREVKVAGNLGARMRRSVGATVVDSAIVAAPFVAPLEDAAQGECQAIYAPYPWPAVEGGIGWGRRRH